MASALADRVVLDIVEHGIAVIRDALPPGVVDALERVALERPADSYEPGGVGRAAEDRRHESVRSDRVIWLDPDHDATRWYLEWAESFRSELNRRLFLGLADYECHLAWYPVGSFYARHLDAFRGSDNRRVSTVLYLNRGWQPTDGGELVIHTSDGESVGRVVSPTFGTLVLFLSDEFPHEVLPALAPRYSIAGWFRVR